MGKSIRIQPELIYATVNAFKRTYCIDLEIFHFQNLWMCVCKNLIFFLFKTAATLNRLTQKPLICERLWIQMHTDARKEEKKGEQKWKWKFEFKRFPIQITNKMISCSCCIQFILPLFLTSYLVWVWQSFLYDRISVVVLTHVNNVIQIASIVDIDSIKVNYTSNTIIQQETSYVDCFEM